jgi:hypothetical protein
MSRPEQVSDLADHELDPHPVSTVYIDRFSDNGDMLTAYGQFVKAAQAAGFIVTGHEIKLARTDEELQKQLKSAQNSWDYQQGEYEKALNGGERPAYEWGLKAWCQREGVDYPFETEAQS